MTISDALTLRRVAAEDLPLTVPLFDAYRQFYGQPSDVQAAQAFLSERLAREESVIFLAELDGRPAGFTQLYPLFSSVGMRRIWLLNDLYVAEEARRRGVSTALLNAARQHGLETGAARLMLSTATDNLAAQATYEAHGWQRDEGFYTYLLPLS
ncbi:GNAT family N-acetyltransferase [Deinococcus sp. KNUC1210]|uniref:GNAT family N-acetyltransferase n=1 Tax=Deinococcus sp. KNUC1210 TaxID=2917691 RepID=UPI001EEFEFC1|nr:GNAT family N-acetyltransferase [Deinococcus sp. KNUC1210]ULH15324.1 GNAT family N-acetyltransferase [Deinococcus sp. KNUC1210]